VTHYYLRKASDAAFRVWPVGECCEPPRSLLDPAWQPLPLTPRAPAHWRAGVGRGYLNVQWNRGELYTDPFSTVPERGYIDWRLGRCSDEGSLTFSAALIPGEDSRPPLEVGEIEAAPAAA